MSITESLFGFTDDDVKAALAHDSSPPDVDNHFRAMKEQYNGFQFNSNQHQAVYNPKMCLHYLDKLRTTGEAPLTPPDTHFRSPGANIVTFPFVRLLIGKFQVKPQPQFCSKGP